MTVGSPPYFIAVYIKTVAELTGRIHPTAISVSTMHLEQAIRAHLTGDQPECMRRLSLVEERITAEQDWLSDMIKQHSKEAVE